MRLAILRGHHLLDMNHELDFTSPGKEEKYMSEHKATQDNIDIDVDVSSTARQQWAETLSNAAQKAASTNETDKVLITLT